MIIQIGEIDINIRQVESIEQITPNKTRIRMSSGSTYFVDDTKEGVKTIINQAFLSS